MPILTGHLSVSFRSYDAIAPIIHEFTYEAMVYDLLSGSMEDHIFRSVELHLEVSQSKMHCVLDHCFLVHVPKSPGIRESPRPVNPRRRRPPSMRGTHSGWRWDGFG